MAACPPFSQTVKIYQTFKSFIFRLYISIPITVKQIFCRRKYNLGLLSETFHHFIRYSNHIFTIRNVDLSARVHVGNCDSRKICINCGGTDRPVSVTVLQVDDPLFVAKHTSVSRIDRSQIESRGRQYSSGDRNDRCNVQFHRNTSEGIEEIYRLLVIETIDRLESFS